MLPQIKSERSVGGLAEGFCLTAIGASLGGVTEGGWEAKRKDSRIYRNRSDLYAKVEIRHHKKWFIVGIRLFSLCCVTISRPPTFQRNITANFLQHQLRIGIPRHTFEIPATPSVIPGGEQRVDVNTNSKRG